MQKDMQIAWVDRLEYLRFYYVQYKFPKLTGNELKKFAWDYLMTPQQYIEAIYRFGEKTGLPNEIVHAARVEMILKQDDEIQIDEKSMRENKQKLDKIVRLYQFAQEVYFKKLDYLTFARDALFVQFPLLKSYKDDTTYLDYSDDKFEKIVARFGEKALANIKKVEKATDAQKLIDESMANLVLTKKLIQEFPSLKYALCKAQKSHFKSQEDWDDFLHAALATSAALTVIPVVGEAAAVAGVGIGAMVLVTDGVRAAKRYQEMAEAEDFAVASFSQMDNVYMQTNEESPCLHRPNFPSGKLN
jgi:hypothetical protein